MTKYNYWRTLASGSTELENISVEARMLELVLTDSALWKDLVEDQESVEKITQGLGIAHDDSYGWHLLNMVRQFRKADLDASVLGRIRALTASELRHVREIYLHRARARMLAEEPD